MAVRTALVTGGAGFIGSHLVAALADSGWQVRVLDLNGPDEALPQGLRQSVDWRRGSVTDPAALDAAMAGVEHVHHLAASAQLWQPDPRQFDAVNLEGTRRVVEAARRHRVARLVHCSSDVVLRSRRDLDRHTPLDEAVRRTVADMAGPYCRAKLAAEAAVLEAAAAGLPAVVVNPAMPIGPGDHSLTPPTRMILDFAAGRTPAWLDTRFSMIDVRDAARGHVLAAQRGRVGARYVLCGGELRAAELLALIGRLTGRAMPRLKVPPGLALAVARLEAVVAAATGRPPKAPLAGVRLALADRPLDAGRMRRDLGLEPRPLDRALADLLDWAVARRLLPPSKAAAPSALAVHSASSRAA